MQRLRNLVAWVLRYVANHLAADGDAAPYDLELYLRSSPRGRLELLRGAWERSREDRQRAFLEGQMIGLTIDLADHPAGAVHGCLCAECRSSD